MFRIFPHQNRYNSLVPSPIISRTPVREALIQLDAEGLLENVPRRGFFLRRVDEKKARDLYRIIGRLDGLAGALAMGFITDKEITSMKDLITSMDQAIITNRLIFIISFKKNFITFTSTYVKMKT
ncbi:GntR family transcriptional regulator [Peribacillus muralis]|uniref:GntR family transcriptional regulator n=1 Tax=Peribacillus muralis TaxID=264697 RepID=UPI00367069A1